MRACWGVLLLVAGCISAAADPGTARRANESRAREIYAELISIDTSDTGDTAKAAHAMERRLVAAGLPAEDVKVFETGTKRGNLVARYRGTGRKRPIIVMAHIDVVPAKRSDWSTDPFELVEKDGYFYGRGTTDDKFMAAAFVSALIRYKAESYKPDRDIILVLATDEEEGDTGKGLSWLLANQRPLLDAELALNEGGWVGMRDGKPIFNSIQVAERNYQSYFIEVHNRGGHAGRPRKDNAIYDLAAALARLGALQFPIEVSELTRQYIETIARHESPEIAATLRGALEPSPSAAVLERLRDLPEYNGQLRTTCAATQVEAGENEGALPRTARATLTCLILPTHTTEDVQKVLEQTIAGTGATVTPVRKEPSGGPSKLPPELLATIATVSKKHWPDAEVIPSMSLGSSDGVFLRGAGIPTFGNSGLAVDLLDTRLHGKDERVAVSAFFEGQQYLYELVKAIAGGK
ncbi:MAG TPA: M20/M25/M40 family metallo-hydrolase [Kofleriaceae bacterium]|nr:M20/M25/M40 family metallo-hydrolase [Kofleriaceae bacterium]